MSEQNIFTVRIVDKDDTENMSVLNTQNFLERFRNEIHVKSPDLIKLIKFGLNYLKIHESINKATQSFIESIEHANLVFYEINERNPELNFVLCDVHVLKETTKLFESEIIEFMNIMKIQIVKTSRLNLEKHEINDLIIEVSELKFITNIENPELESSISFYNELVDFLKTIVQHIQENQDINTPEINPFRDQQTADLFEYIEKNWNNKAATKWGYIWNYFFEQDESKLTNPTDFKTYLISRKLLTNPNTNFDSCISKKRYNELNELKKAFLENLDLN